MEKIKNMMRVARRRPQILFVVMSVAVLVGVGGVYTISFVYGDKIPESVVTMEAVADGIYDGQLVAVIGESDPVLLDAVIPRDSWPAEIISSEISQIQSSRDGVITDWYVRIGDAVFAGGVLGKISAPPATPELIAMLAESAENSARFRAQAVIADTFAIEEAVRIASLERSLEGEVSETNPGSSFTALNRMRENLANRSIALRSFMERALSKHVSLLTNYTDWRYVRAGGLYKQYGAHDQNIQSLYESSLVRFVEELKNAENLPVDSASDYFALAVRLANNSGDAESGKEFRTIASEDQSDFFSFLSEYREAEAQVADKETEYKIMISERRSAVERDKASAYAEADAARAAYMAISSEIKDATFIVATRSGTVSAIYKKTGDSVGPGVPVAVITGYSNERIVRMRVPNNTRKPVRGDIVSVIRPGFSTDEKKAQIIGAGDSLDDTGSYMADAIMVEDVDWPAGTSVRVIPPESSNIPLITFSSVWWDEDGFSKVWKVSTDGKIFSQKLELGRILGALVEVYSGATNGDRYIIDSSIKIREGMFLSELAGNERSVGGGSSDGRTGSGGHQHTEGMEM